MKKRFLTIISTALCAFMTFGSFSACAQSETVSKVRDLVDGIIDFKLSQTESSSVQEWIDGKLSENAGMSGEWYVFGLSRYDEYDFSAYNAALNEYLSEKEVRSASSRLKFAIVLACTESGNSYIQTALDSSVGGQGVMSFIYGLHMFGNGYSSSTTTAEETIKGLLALRKNDGGWAVTGDTAETDATAMAVQALAPYYDSDNSVKEAVDTALSLLSERQMENGVFASYGVPNPESTGQVLLALTSMGIDPQADERFIKNGNTLIDGIELFRNEDGSFRHEIDGTFNESATVQTFYCLVSYLRFSEGKTPLYVLEKDTASDTPLEEAPSVTETQEAQPTAEEELPQEAEVTTQKGSYKPVVCLIIAGAGVISIIVLVILKKAKRQNIIAAAVITAAGIIFVLVTDFSSADSYYGKVTVKTNPVGTVTLSVRCDTVVGKSDAEYIPDDGIIVTDEFQIEQGETAFDILVEAAKKHSIQLDYSGASDTVYIVGINHLYEFDFGDLSGWMYTVNDEKPSVGCDGYTLSDGDRVDFVYTCEMGNDLQLKE
ncbi:MAG: DUF4430 domain-containing protein [Ruminiclostridium sp.]|nr:DUF4430 domain-containing protein [Ruminiclostridium sp.]